MCVCVCESRLVMLDSLQPHGLYGPWNSPGQNTGVGLSLLQGIFPTQGSNPGLLHCMWILYYLSHKGNPVKTIILPKLIYILKAIPIKIPSGFCVDIRKVILKYIWTCKGLRRVKTISKKNKVGKLTLHNFKTCFQS